MTREELIDRLKNFEMGWEKPNSAFSDFWRAVIDELEQEPTSEMVHVETLHQVMWERDIAIEQLKELGYSFGQKIGPCDDAISREAVVQTIEDAKNAGELTFARTIKRIMDLPSVTQKSGKWIPVSERLPKDGTYLVTVERIIGHPTVDINSFAKDLYKVDEFDFCDKKGKCGWYNYDSEYGYWEDDKVIAWMPLPEPYKPQESEDKE